MDRTERCQISGPLARVLRISSLLCVVPLQLAPLRNEPQRVSISGARKFKSARLSYIASISRKRQIGGYVVISLIRMEKWQFSKLNYTCSYEAGNALATVVLQMSTDDIRFDGVNNMNRYMSYVNKLEEINQELESSHLDINIRYSGIITWGYLSIIVFFFGCHVFFKMDFDLKDNEYAIHNLTSLAISLGFFFKHLFNVLLCLQFVFIVCSVNDTLRTLNKRLRSLIFKLKLYDAMKIKNIANAHTTIRRLHRAHVSICELVRSIDEGEGALVAILLLSKIMECADTLYHFTSIFYTFLGDWTYGKFENLGVTLIWAFIKGILIVLMVEHCHNTQEEFQTTQNHVSHLMCASADREFKHELSRFYDQVVDDTPAFSPLGICVLTRQLLAGIIGGIATF
ncbi:uncharacterized protein LOC124533052 [Vanessa cardui]|uniref:uncharacterized protein LOC124533052 n=1 Tax=Vanessa cardui TaxID=171605 RepID=UPI001F12AEF6|nr:uncharacterized protein LOC124533052 [Vanessa cardui]